MSNAVPTLIRGQLYPSITAAALALGVVPSRVHQALECGRTDTVGLGKAGMTGRPGQPCYVNGRRWPSRRAAADALGVTPAAISQALRRPGKYVRPGGKGSMV